MPLSLDSLNDVQKLAVTYNGDAHCLILAGAGSGKTRVLTHRIAWLVSQGVPPWAILAITFTNKAAREMKSRAVDLLPEVGNDILLSTFHSFGARFLRKYADYVGLEKSFSIYSENEQKSLIKSIMMEMGILNKSELENAAQETEVKNDKAMINEYTNKIMGWKEKGLSVDEAFKESKTRALEDIACVYRQYEKLLLKNNAVDFAGLLLWPLYILENYSEIRDSIRRKYSHILVDEFQDTNGVQLQLLDQLCGPHTRLTVVGDDDQSIYTWRGAEPDAILRFTERYGKAETFKLEQNYRSTSPILNCAGNLIANNRIRTEKRLWTDLSGGEKVHWYSYENDYEEANGVINTLRKLRDKKQLGWRDFAILYRKNSQSVVFERECARKGIPYQIVGGIGFFEREEIVDLMSYLRILVNPSDRIALRRIINKPVRGIGEKTCDKMIEWLDKKMQLTKDRSENVLMSLFESIIDGSFKIPRAGAKTIQGCRDLKKMLTRVENWRTCAPCDILNTIIDETKYLDYLKSATAKKGQEFEEAVDRIESLRRMMNIYQKEKPNDLANFIEEMTLVRPDDKDDFAVLNLLTIHSAKGLEFDTVFIVGVEQGVLPLERGGVCDIEEERRLMYVAMTRAKRSLYITHSSLRHEYGRMTEQQPSQFFDEQICPGQDDLIEKLNIKSDNSLYSSRPRLAWSSKLNEYGDFRENRKKHHDENDFIPDAGYEEDAVDIFADVEKSVPKQALSVALNYSGATVRDKNGKPLHVGDRVRQCTHGVGTIISLDGSGSDSKAQVTFTDGKRTIVARFLELVSKK